MDEDNKRNLQYFEHTSMRGLYECIECWQAANRKRFQSLDIQRDGDLFCCIALTNPTEVTIVGGAGASQVHVMSGSLYVQEGTGYYER
jgi:hypothetical protein